MAEEKIWNKFHPLFGPDLKVGFETTFPKTVAPADLDPLYEKSGLFRHILGETVRRVYEPAVKIVGSCLDGEVAQVFFEPVPQAGSLFRRLVFSRKLGESQKPRCWIVAARHGEIAHFGFDSWNSKDLRYLALAYPGQSDGQFAPVYFKIQEKKGGEKENCFVYLEVWALDDEVQVLVCARRIDEKAAPAHLRSEVSNEGAEAKLVYSF